ncbi:cytochrome c nitrite reductase small subunit [Gemmatimonadota bacterium]
MPGIKIDVGRIGLSGQFGRRSLLVAVLLGLLLGIGGYTFQYAEGLSYFSPDPMACVNCHIMQPQFDAWQKASHHTAATCVECHLPHGVVGKYIAKAENGYHHSRGFTFQDYHEPIMIKEKNRRILEENCVRCHEAVVHEVIRTDERDPGDFRCLHWHARAGHGETAGLGGPAQAHEVEADHD